MKLLNPAFPRLLKRPHYPLDVMLMCVRWYVAWFCRDKNRGTNEINMQSTAYIARS
jgi:hypothetical protein